MRHTSPTGRTMLLMIVLGVALASCTATATEEAMPYGYGGPGATYYADPAELGYEPLSGEIALGGDVFFRNFPRRHLHQLAGGFRHGLTHGAFAHGAMARGHAR